MVWGWFKIQESEKVALYHRAAYVLKGMLVVNRDIGFGKFLIAAVRGLDIDLVAKPCRERLELLKLGIAGFDNQVSYEL